MKVKVLRSEEEVNEFISNVRVIDIKPVAVGGDVTYTLLFVVVYEDA